MKTEQCLTGCVVLGIGLVSSALLTGCAGSPPWGAWSESPAPAKVQSALGRPETFIYFSAYEIYRQMHTREYVYLEHGRWVHSDRSPARISESTLRTSPSVMLTLTDTPEHGHEAVKRSYPRNESVGPALMAALP